MVVEINAKTQSAKKQVRFTRFLVCTCSLVRELFTLTKSAGWVRGGGGGVCVCVCGGSCTSSYHHCKTRRLNLIERIDSIECTKPWSCALHALVGSTELFGLLSAQHILCLFKISAAYYEQAYLSCWHKQEFEAASIKLCIINIHIYVQWYSESSIIYANILSKRFVCDKNVQICTNSKIPQKTVATVTFGFHKLGLQSQGNIHIAYFSWRIMPLVGSYAWQHPTFKTFHFTGLKLHSWLIYKYFYAWNC